MAKAMVTLTWCDQHLSEKDEEVQAVAMPPFEGYQLDLCPECAAPVEAMRAFYQQYGSKGSRTAQRRRGGQPKSPEIAAAEATGQHPCPACDQVLSTRASLTAHTRQQHGKTLGELQGEPLSFVCEECGKGFTTAQGRAVHQRAHGRQQSAPAEKPARKSA